MSREITREELAREYEFVKREHGALLRRLADK